MTAVRTGITANNAPSGSGTGSTAVAYTEVSAQQHRRDDALTDFQQRRVARRLEELEVRRFMVDFRFGRAVPCCLVRWRGIRRVAFCWTASDHQ